ncbi:MAG: hypothetical protein AB7O56_02990 [Bauldia sp.]
MNGDEERRPAQAEKPRETPADERAERHPVELHDPFARFDFEPTNGADF